MLTESAQQALEILRDGSQFQWYIIPIFAIIVYIYATEVQNRKWDIVFAGLAFWGMDWINEIINSIFFHLNGEAPFWGAPGATAYLIFIGLNIEIMFMFSIAGIGFSKVLLPKKETKILGIPNRWFVAITGSAFCVFVEVLLNQVGALTWDWSWWDANSPWLIFLFGYFHFFAVAFWVHDMKTIKQKAITVGVIFSIAIIGILVFGVGLQWI
jgi:hypothetical protein